MVLLTIPVLRLKEWRSVHFLFIFKFLFTRSIVISSNDSLVMLEVVDLLIKSKIESISSVCDLHALSDDISIIDVKID